MKKNYVYLAEIIDYKGLYDSEILWKGVFRDFTTAKAVAKSVRRHLYPYARIFIERMKVM